MSKTVLVVDDEAGYRDLLQSDLMMDGYKVLTASNGMEGMDAVQKEKIDLVITDMRMPGMDGLEMIYEIRKIRPDIPIILATGFAEEHLVSRAEQLKVSATLRKPFAMDEMNSAIKAALGPSADGGTNP